MNPKITIKLFKRNIFQRVSHDRFWAGYQNQKVEGKFGYLEPDDSIPLPIKRALTLMVVKQLKQDFSGGDDPQASIRDRIIKEVTDGHSYELDAKTATAEAAGLTGDLDIDRIILRYRMPIIGMSSQW